MKVKKNIFKTMLFLMISTLVGCNQESNDSFNYVNKDFNKNELIFSKESQINNLKFNYISKKEDGKIISELIIYNSNGKILESTQIIDTNIPAYKLIVYQEIIKNAEKLKQELNPKLINQIIPEFEIFARSILFDSNNQNNQELIQTIFYQNSILNTIKRSYENNNNCECLPHPGYFVAQKPFWCQEDFLVNVKLFIQILKNDSSNNLQNKDQVLTFLEEYNKTEVSFDKISKYIEKKEDFLNRIQTNFNNTNNVNNALAKEKDCVKGTDLGCCGNYSGCCWYWSYYCLDHDLECLGCDKWHCGPACVPGL
jgi:hypothetical protein